MAACHLPQLNYLFLHGPIAHPDYNALIIWDDEDEGLISSKLFAVSENTDKLVRDSFSKAIPRRQLQEKHGNSRCPPMKVPKLVQDRMSQGDTCIELDRSLARLQALCVDAAGTSSGYND